MFLIEFYHPNWGLQEIATSGVAGKYVKFYRSPRGRRVCNKMPIISSMTKEKRLCPE